MTTYGNLFEIADTATDTDTAYHWGTGIALTGSEVNNPRVRHITLSNDGVVSLLYRIAGNVLGDATTIVQKTLAAGENVSHDVISPVLWVEVASGTCVFRAWGTG